MMNKKVAYTLLAATVSVFFGAPSFAGEGEAMHDDAKAAQHQDEARHEAHKARRDAARGDVAGAERHAQEAKHEEHKARHDEHKADRDATH